MAIDFSVLPDKIAAAAIELSNKIDFEVLNEKGANGYVLIGRNRQLHRKVVVKFYFWGDGAHAEPKLLADLASPNVLEVHDAAAIDDDDAYFITPYCDQGDLDDVIAAGRIGVRQAVDMLLQIARGASFIHGKGFVHRDLKPSNIFRRKDGSLVIGDFGSVVKKGDTGYAETKSRHSLLYRTPEEITTDRTYERSDVYQLGIILYQLLGGHLSYEMMDWLNAKEKAEYAKLSYPDNEIYANDTFEKRIIGKGKLLDMASLPEWCPPEILKVIRKCCRIDYTKRFESVSELIANLNNLRSSLPDWRLEPEPVLYRPRAKFRIVGAPDNYSIEKMVESGATWRRVRAAKPSTLRDAVASAQML